MTKAEPATDEVIEEWEEDLKRFGEFDSPDCCAIDIQKLIARIHAEKDRANRTELQIQNPGNSFCAYCAALIPAKDGKVDYAGAREHLLQCKGHPIMAMVNTICHLGDQNETLRTRINELEKALSDLVLRCDGEEGVCTDGSNIQTIAAHAALGEGIEK